MLLLSLLLLFLPGKDAGAVGISLNNNWQEQVTSSGTVVFAPLGSLTQYPGTLAELGILQAGLDTLGWLFGENVANPASTSPRALELYQPAGGLSLAINQQTNELAIGLGISGGFPVFKGEPNGISMAGAESVGGAVYLSSSVWFSGANQPVQINIQSGAEIQTNAPILNMIANNPAIQAAPPNSYLTISPGINTGPINAGNINAANISAQAVTANNGLVVASSQAVFNGTATFNSGVFTGGGVFIPQLTQTPDIAQNWLNLGNDPNGSGGSLIMTSIGASPGVGIYPFNSLGTLDNPQGFVSGYGIYVLSPSYSDPQGNVIDNISGGPTEFVSVVSTDPIGSPITSTGTQSSGWAISAGPRGNYSVAIATTGNVCIGQSGQCNQYSYFGSPLPLHQLEVYGDIFAQTNVTAASSITASAFFGDGTHLGNVGLLNASNTWALPNSFQSSVTASAFFGNGAGITGITASGLTSGTNTWTAQQTFDNEVFFDSYVIVNSPGRLGVGTATPDAPLQVAGYLNFEGNGVPQSIFIGGAAGNGATSQDLIALGNNAGSSTSGLYNLAIGNDALDCQQSGTSNIAIGDGAGGVGTVCAYSEGVAVGYQAGTSLTSGYDNTLLGYFAGKSISTGHDNTALGDNAASSLSSGSGNIAVGSGAQFVFATANNNLNLGNVVYATGTVGGSSPSGNMAVSIATNSAINGNGSGTGISESINGVNVTGIVLDVGQSAGAAHFAGSIFSDNGLATTRYQTYGPAGTSPQTAFTKPFSFPVAFTWIGSLTLASGTTIFYNVPASSRTIANISGVVENAGVGGSGDAIVCHDSAGSVTLGFAAGVAEGTTTSIAANFAQNDPLFCYIETTATTQPTINVNLEIAPQ